MYQCWFLFGLVPVFWTFERLLETFVDNIETVLYNEVCLSISCIDFDYYRVQMKKTYNIFV